MNNYFIKQVPGTSPCTQVVSSVALGALLMAAQLSLAGYGHDKSTLFNSQQHVAKIASTSKTYGKYSNFITGEFEDINPAFQEKITSFYAKLMIEQEYLGEEFEKVLHDNLIDLLVYT